MEIWILLFLAVLIWVLIIWNTRYQEPESVPEREIRTAPAAQIHTTTIPPVHITVPVNQPPHPAPIEEDRDA